MAFGQCRAVELVGGVAVTPWRGSWLAAQRAAVPVVAEIDELDPAQHAHQVVVHLGKSREALRADIATALQVLRLPGRLLLCGGNEVGIASAVKQVAAGLDQAPAILANRARARVAAFTLAAAPSWSPPPMATVVTSSGSLRTAAGVFAADRIDAGSALLLERLSDCQEPERVVDLGAGIGVLGLAAARQWPRTRVHLAEADRRACRCCRLNAAGWQLTERVTTHWWDAAEALPLADGAVDLVLCNPPWHSGKAVDLGPPRAMLAQAFRLLRPGGQLLLVANRHLPYEGLLRGRGRLGVLAETGVYKLLLVTT